jgi:hypothetical protein
MPALVQMQMISIAFKESQLQENLIKIARGINKNRFRNLSATPLTWMNPNIPFEFGSTGVKTIALKEIR